jgi:DNA-binding MarR family transcriptional regulator
MENKTNRALFESLVVNLKHIRLLEAKMFTSSKHNTEGIPIHHLMIMQRLTDEGPISISTIKREYNVSASAATQFVQHLEKKGYIHRVRSEKDKRSFLIKLSDLGKETTQRVSKLFLEETKVLVDYLGLEDSQKLNDILVKIMQFYAQMEELENEQENKQEKK